MTLPIIPGPFSPIQSAGNAVAQIIAGGMKGEDIRQQDAMNKLKNIDQLVNAGVLSRSIYADPQYHQLFVDAGIPQPTSESIVPSPQEATARVTTPTIAGVAPGSIEARAMAGVPSQSSVNVEKIKAGETAAIQPGTAQARSVAGVPAPGVAASGEAAQQATNEQVATTEKLRQKILSDANVGPIFKKLSVAEQLKILPYLIEEVRGNAEIMAARNRAAGANAPDYIDKQLDDLRNQQATINQSLSQLDPNGIIRLSINMLPLGKDGKRDLTKLPKSQQAGAKQVLDVLDKSAEIQGDIDKLNKAGVNRALGGQPGPAPVKFTVPPTKLSPTDANFAAKRWEEIKAANPQADPQTITNEVINEMKK